MVPPSQSEFGFYSRYFLVPERKEGYIISGPLRNCSFNMLTLKLIQRLVHYNQSKGDIFSNSDHSETREGVSQVHFHILPFALVMNYFLSDLKGCLAVVWMDNNYVVLYLNHRRGMCSSMFLVTKRPGPGSVGCTLRLST